MIALVCAPLGGSLAAAVAGLTIGAVDLARERRTGHAARIVGPRGAATAKRRLAGA